MQGMAESGELIIATGRTSARWPTRVSIPAAEKSRNMPWPGLSVMVLGLGGFCTPLKSSKPNVTMQAPAATGVVCGPGPTATAVNRSTCPSATPISGNVGMLPGMLGLGG